MVKSRYPERIACAYLYPITKYGYPPDIRQTLGHIEEMADMGFSAIELEGIGEENIGYLYQHQEEVAAKLEACGCRVAVLCVVLPQLGADDPDLRTRSLEWFEKGCEVARRLGAKAVLDNGPLLPLEYPRQAPIRRHYGKEDLVSLALPDSFSWNRYWPELVATYRQACAIAARYGLTYQLHPCEGSLITGTESFANFVTAVDAPNLFFNLDTANQFYFKDNLQLSVLRLADRIDYIHLSDNGGQRVEHLVPGNGIIHWDSFFSGLRTIGFKGAFAIDVGGAETGIADIRSAYQHTASWLGEKLKQYSLLVTMLFLSCIFSVACPAQMLEVTALGARGDGVTDNTAVLQKAIDSCAVTGGKVYFPAGTFLSATLYLKSNVTLYLSGGATILGYPEASHYPYQQTGIRFYGDQWARQSLIFCKDQVNVAIEGHGTIDGQGGRFVTTTLKKPDRYRNRPYLLWFAGCKNVSVKDVHLKNSAFWMQHYLCCDNVHVDGITIWNHSNKNNDMMDIDGCRYVTISNVIGDSDDDGITIKSTSPRLSEDITVTNCVLSSHCNALKLGTESTGGFRNVVISNCVIKPSAQRTSIYGRPDGNGGLALEMVDGGTMENVNIDNIVIEGPQVPIFLRLGNRARKYSDEATAPPLGKMRNIHLSHITATGADATGCSLTGIRNAPLEGITLSDISLETDGSDSVVNWRLPVVEKEAEYPEGTMFGRLPAYGFYIRYAKDLRLNNITIRSRNKESRPGIVTNQVRYFSFSGLDIQSGQDTHAVLYLSDSQEGSIWNSRSTNPAAPFLVTDGNSKNIVTGQTKK
ncbi:MAG TPA: TIM barrel protein [Puia sp.]|jgi:sugar phosphate isomerase/epimerase